MLNSPVILFPYSHIAYPDLRKILDLFGRLTICQPWFIDIPLPTAKTQDLSLVHIIRPPSHLKPKGDIKGLLSEYNLWIRHNQDKGYTASLRAAMETPTSEDTSWEIGKMINRMGGGFPAPLEKDTLKWHIVLHLAWELEKNMVGAIETLNKVKQQKPPLEDALEKPASSHGLLDDLSQSEMYPFLDNHLLRQIFEAWLGLFGGYLQNDVPLITFDRHVMNCVMEIFEDKSVTHSGDSERFFPPQLTSAQINFTLKHLPQVSDNSNRHRDPVLTGLSGKTIIMLDD
ncbi:MAG: hypothetical protein HQ551_13675 [Desulfobacteraceae bacterium]|nr:hypothetical protein [Desulfobacteraceae bacterium]